MSKSVFWAAVSAAVLSFSAGPGSAANFNECELNYDLAGNTLEQELVNLIVALQAQLDTRPSNDPHYALLVESRLDAETELHKLRNDQTGRAFVIRLICSIDVSPA